MYCTKCGNKLSENAQFCSNCGAKVGGETKRFEFQKFDVGTIINSNAVQSIKQKSRTLENYKGWYFSAIACLIICTFFLGSDMFQVSFKAFMSTRTMELSMFENRNGLKTLFVLVYIAAAAAMLLPLVLGRDWGNIYFYPALGWPIIAVVVLLCVMLSAKSEMSGSSLAQAVDATAKLSASGWFYIIFNAAAVAFTFKTMCEIEKWQNLQPEEKTEYKSRPYWCLHCGAEGPFEKDCPVCGSCNLVYDKPAYAKTIEEAMKAQQEKLTEKKLLEENKTEIRQMQETSQENNDVDISATISTDATEQLQEALPAEEQTPTRANKERQTVRVYTVKEKR